MTNRRNRKKKSRVENKEEDSDMPLRGDVLPVNVRVTRKIDAELAISSAVCTVEVRMDG